MVSLQYEPRWTMSVLEASAALLTCDGKVWLSRRKDFKDDHLVGCLECPGGASAREGEPILSTAQREVLEETGLRLESDRFRYRGSIHVDKWTMWLYSVELGALERPKNTEPFKRGDWHLVEFEKIRFRMCTPALGALLSILMDELRIHRRETDAKTT